jgi:hypothetical protein
MNYFAHLPTLSSQPYTDYFVNEFIPLHLTTKGPDHKDYKKIYNVYFQKEVNDPVIAELDKLLQTRYEFPPIQTFVLFRHTSPQGIHIDFDHTGEKIVPRYASLNLPLIGFESTKMVYYKSKVDTPDFVDNKESAYYSIDNVEPVAELASTNDWVIVDPSKIHNIVNSDFNNPRYTLAIRFETNPTLTDLLNKTERYMVRGTGIEPVLTA